MSEDPASPVRDTVKPNAALLHAWTTLVATAVSVGAGWWLVLQRHSRELQMHGLVMGFCLLVVAVLAVPWLLQRRVIPAAIVAILAMLAATPSAYVLKENAWPPEPHPAGTAADDARMFLSVLVGRSGEPLDSASQSLVLEDGERFNVLVRIQNRSQQVEMRDPLLMFRAEREAGGIVRLQVRVEAIGYLTREESAVVERRDLGSADVALPDDRRDVFIRRTRHDLTPRPPELLVTRLEVDGSWLLPTRTHGPNDNTLWVEIPLVLVAP